MRRSRAWQGDSALGRVRSISAGSLRISSELEGDILVALNRPLMHVKLFEAQTSLSEAGLNTAVVDLKLSALPEVQCAVF